MRSDHSETDMLPATSTKYQAIEIDSKSAQQEQPALNDELYGYAVMLSSSLFLKTMSLCTRTASVYYNVSVPNLIFLRGSSLLFLGLFCTFFFAKPTEVFNVPRPLLPLLLARGIFGATSLALAYKAISLLPLYIATTLFFLNPFFTMLLSGIFLGERVTLMEFFAAGISLFGIFLVGNPSFDTVNSLESTSLLGVGLVVLSAAVVSVAYVSIRALGTRVHYLTTLLSLATMGTFVGIALGGASLPGLTKGVMIALGGSAVGFVGQCCLNIGFQYCRASTGTVLRTVDVPIAYLLGLIFLNEVPQWISISGSTLVVIGTIIIGLVGLRKKKSQGENN